VVVVGELGDGSAVALAPPSFGETGALELCDVAAGACPEAPPQPTKKSVATEARKGVQGERGVRIAEHATPKPRRPRRNAAEMLRFK
jgi:hypothetical protein